MKKGKLAAGIAAAALVAVLSVSAAYAGNQGKSVSALWGEILKQSADEGKISMYIIAIERGVCFRTALGESLCGSLLCCTYTLTF